MTENKTLKKAETIAAISAYLYIIASMILLGMGVYCFIIYLNLPNDPMGLAEVLALLCLIFAMLGLIIGGFGLAGSMVVTKNTGWAIVSLLCTGIVPIILATYATLNNAFICFLFPLALIPVAPFLLAAWYAFMDWEQYV